MFFIENFYLCSYGDNIQLYIFDCNMNDIKEKLYRDLETLDIWFYNYMALSSGEVNFMYLGSNLSVDEIFVYKDFKA